MSPAPRGSGPSFFAAFPFPHAGALSGLAVPPPRVRVFEPADLHLTLAFFGASGPDRARAGFATIDAGAMQPVEVSLGGARLLGNPRHPSAIARVVDEGAESLTSFMAASRDRALEAAGLEAERRAPLAHLTVARLARRSTDADRARAEAWMRTIAPTNERFVIDRVALYTWSEARTGGEPPPRGTAPLQFRIVDERRLGRER